MLINPPSPFLINERVAYNSGLVRVATQLKADGHDINLVDCSGDKNYLENISHSGEYDAYLFSSTTPQFPSTYKMFKTLKSLYPNKQYIIGGAHASAVSSLKNKNIPDKNIEILNKFDTVFNGEGEDTTNIFKKGWVSGKLIKSIDDTLIPDTSLIDIKSYKYFINDKLTTNITTQRGCPNQCAFCCGRDIEMYNRTRAHSPERVIKELDILNKKYGYDSFMWYDDEININTSRLEELCKLLSTRPYQHRGFITSDKLVRHPETAKWLKKAGFVKLCTGVESGSDRILKLIKKNTNYKMNLEARRIIGNEGIHYESFILIGHPSETLEDVDMSQQWLLEAKPDDFDLNLITPYPGSRIYDEAEPSNEFEGYQWNYKGMYFNKPDYSTEDSYYKGVLKEGSSNIRTKGLNTNELIYLRDKIEKEVRDKLK